MDTKLVRFTQWVRAAPQRSYHALMGLLSDPEGLRESFERQAGNKAAGSDGVRKADYAREVDERLASLSHAYPVDTQNY